LRTSSTRAVVAVFLAAALAGSACTMRRPDHSGHQHRTLFGPTEGAKPNDTEGEVVAVDADSVKADSDEIEIDLAGVPTKVTRERVMRRNDRSFSWFGRTPGRGQSNVQVTVEGDHVSAHVDTDDGSQVVATSTSGGKGLRTRLNPDVLKEESDPEAVPQAGDATAAAAEDEVSTQAAGDTVIDVMIVYNSAVLRSYTSAGTVQAVAQRMIDKANKSFTDSLIRLQYRLVNVSQVPDAEIAARVSFFGRDNVGNLQRSANSTTTRTGQLRNQYGADLVQAWGGYTNVCGQGYQPSVTQNLGAAYGVSVINNMRSCTEGQAVSHELGHNLGGGHDRITSNRPSGGGDAFGMIDKTHRFLTIMAYPQNCGSTCVQTWTFSNPAVRYNGYPTGIAGSIDNARVINIVGPKAAANKATRV
jgi:hypothetical protein